MATVDPAKLLELQRELYGKGKTKDGKRPVVMVDFESIEQMLGVQLSRENAEQAETRKGPGYGAVQSHSILWLPPAEAAKADKSRSWRGDISSLEEFKGLLHEGWRDGAARMTETVGEVSVPRVQSIRRRKVFAADGDEVDMHRVYAGDLERAWESTERRLVAGNSRNARIWVEGCFNAYVEADQFFWRGAVACAMVDALEEAGYRVEVMGYDQSSSSYRSGPQGQGDEMDFICRYPIKGFMEPLDMPRMAAVTAHAGFLRGVLFAVMLAAPYKVTGGLGHSIHSRPDFAGEDDIVISGMTSRDEAIVFLREAMEKYKLEQ